MGWARYAHSMRVFVFNSGLFFLRPTPAALELLEKVADRVETEGGWDQAVFNEAIFFPSSPRNEVGWAAVGCLGWVGRQLRFGECRLRSAPSRSSFHRPASAAASPAALKPPTHPDPTCAPPHFTPQDPAVTRRAMDILKFTNSKVLFTRLRHNAPLYESLTPVMVHVKCVGWVLGLVLILGFLIFNNCIQ
jgi:hypothetical protein